MEQLDRSEATRRGVVSSPVKAQLARLWRDRRWQECLAETEAALAALPPAAKPPRELLFFRVRLLASDPAQRRAGLEAARRATELYPEDVQLWQFRALAERRNGFFLKAFAACNRMRRLKGGLDDDLCRRMFEILVEKRRYGSAYRLYEYAVARGFDQCFSYACMAEVALYREDVKLCRQVLRAAASRFQSTLRYGLYASVLERMAAERAHPRAMTGVRHIAIGGVAFTGSTLFGVILGSVPGVCFGGETHCLYDLSEQLGDGRRATMANRDEPVVGRRTGLSMISRATVADRDVPVSDWPIACRVCGPDCAVFTPDFRRTLAAMEYGRYAEIARRMGTAILVTSDKNFNNYWLEDPLFRFDLIVLFKPLQSQVWSALKQKASHGGAATGRAAEDSVRILLDRWARDYGMLLRHIRPKGRSIVLNWNEFTYAPRAHLSALLRLLDLPGDGDLFEKVTVSHLIGGNTGVDIDGIHRDGRVEVRPAEPPVLDRAIVEAILQHPEAPYIERVLEGRYRRMFGGCAR